MKLHVGKLAPQVLTRLLSRLPRPSCVLVGPAYGEDAAAIALNDETIVVASDPVTFATDLIGYYAVSVNANDVAAHGAKPKYFLATILLPEGTDEIQVEQVFNQINESCAKIGVVLIGGHTEVTRSVNQVVVSGCMIGEVKRGSLICTSGARVGDDIILVGGIAIEGSAILAREAKEDLKARGVPNDVLMRASQFLYSPGICVVNYAMSAMDVGGVTSMHDPTEGGLAMALRELAAAADVGIVIRRESIHILPECRVICKAVGLDPLGLIASGSLLVVCDPAVTDRIVERLRSFDISVSVIGRIVEKSCGVKFEDGEDVPIFERDEIARYFEECYPTD